MKEYKYTIDGKKYEVTIGDIADNVVSVTVNGEDYKVEMEPEKEPEKQGSFRLKNGRAIVNMGTRKMTGLSQTSPQAMSMLPKTTRG